MLSARWPESRWLYQLYGMKDQFPLRCTLFVLIWCCYSLDGLNTFDSINDMTWQISFPCGALYLHFIRSYSWLYPIDDQLYGMKNQFPLWCTLFVLIWCCYSLDGLNTFDSVNDMTWQISFPCGALYLHFIHSYSWLYIPLTINYMAWKISFSCGALYLCLSDVAVL